MLKFLSLALFLYFGLAVALYIFQRSLIYFPVATALTHKLAEIFIEVNGIQLQGLVANSGQKRVLFYFGGNSEQVAYSLTELSSRLPSTTVVGFYYRGYGDSKGEPSEKALIADALAVYDKMARDFQEVVVMGRSLGSSVAIQLAKQRHVDGLILVTPFDSIVNIAQDIYWFFPVRWMLWDKYESVKVAPHLNCRILALIAEQDNTVREKYSNNLVQHLPQELVETKVFPAVGHNNIETAEAYYSAISQFISP